MVGMGPGYEPCSRVLNPNPTPFLSHRAASTHGGSSLWHSFIGTGLAQLVKMLQDHPWLWSESLCRATTPLPECCQTRGQNALERAPNSVETDFLMLRMTQIVVTKQKQVWGKNLEERTLPGGIIIRAAFTLHSPGNRLAFLCLLPWFTDSFCPSHQVVLWEHHGFGDSLPWVPFQLYQ